jgi:uncharacterized protein YjiS (DUF1127 family)
VDTTLTHRGIKRWLEATIAILRLWSQKSRQRHALRELDDHQLADIGITRWDAKREAQKWFWR